MPHRKNGVNKWKPLYSENGHLCDSESEEMTTNLQPQENFELLLDVFPNVDKEIIQAVLLEYSGNLNEVIEKLQEISEGRPRRPVARKADVDLAVIACSLLASESQAVSANRIDIFENSEEDSDVLNSPTAENSVFHGKDNSGISTNYSDTKMNNPYIRLDDSGSTFSVNKVPYHVGVGRYFDSSETLASGIGEFLYKNAYKDEVDITHLLKQNGNIKPDRVDNTNSKTVKSKSDCSDDYTGSNKLRQIESENNMVSGMYNNKLQGFPNSAVSYTVGSKQSYISHGEDNEPGIDCNEMHTILKNCSFKDVNSFASNEGKPQKKVNSRVHSGKKHAAKVLSDGMIPTYVNGSCSFAKPSADLLGQLSSKRNEFYNNFENGVHNIHYRSPEGFDPGESMSPLILAPYLNKTQNIAVAHNHSAANATKSARSNKSRKNGPDMKPEFLQNNDTAKTSSHLSGDFTLQSSSSVSDLPLTSLQKTNGFTYSSVNGEISEDTKKSKPTSQLSINALEFVPRPLVSLHSQAFVAQNKMAQVSATTGTVKLASPGASQPPPGKSSGKKKSGKAKKSKQNGRAEAVAAVSDNDVNPFSEPRSSVDTVSPHMSAENNEKISSSAKMRIDPTDPLGWGDVFSHLTSSLVDPKPQRQKKTRKFSGGKPGQKAAPSPGPSPWQVDCTQVSADSKSHEPEPSSPEWHIESPVFTAKSSQVSSGIGSSRSSNLIETEHEIPSDLLSTDSKASVVPSPVAQKIDSCFSISKRLPPSLAGRAARAAVIAQADLLKREVPFKVLSPVSVAVGARTPQNPPSAPAQPHLIKNKLQLRGVKTSIGVIRRYILEKRPVMVILRGLPGSGKSYLARKLLEESQKMGTQGVVLSTDEYFLNMGQYCFNKNTLPDAHIWNKKRALHYMKESVSPVIIDNTNTTMWELLPYAVLALEHNYDVQLFEPDTAWKVKVVELARKNSHNVSKEHIKRMKERWECFTLDDVLKKASQILASRKHRSAPPPDSDLTPVQNEAKVKLSVDSDKNADSEHNTAALSAEVTHVKNSVVSCTPPDQDLGLTDWFGDRIQQSPKQKIQKRKMTASSNKSLKTEITLDFLDHSLKKAMNNPLKISESQVGASVNGNGSSQSAQQKKRNLTSSIGHDITLVERQLSDDSSNSEIVTPTNKSQFFEGNSELSAPVDDWKDNRAYDRVNGVSGDPVASSDLPVRLQQHKEVNGDSALNSSWSTSDSYQTCFSSSGVSSYSHAEGGEEYDDSFSAKNLFDGDIDDIDVYEQGSCLLLEKPQLGNRKTDLSETKQTKPESAALNEKERVCDLDTSSRVGKRYLDSYDVGAGSKDTVSEVEHDSSRNISEFADCIYAQSSSRSLLPETDQFLNSGKAASLRMSGNDEKMTADSMELIGSVAHPSIPLSLVQYSDSDDAEKELPAPRSKGESFQPCSDSESVTCVEESSVDVGECNLELPLENMSLDSSHVDVISAVQLLQCDERRFAREISIDRSTQSSEDSMTSGREPSPQIDSPASPEGQKKKKKKRVRKGRNQGPLFEDSLKMKSKTQNWSLFVKEASENSTSSGDSVIIEPESPRPDSTSSSTQSDPYYFSIVHKLNSPAFNHLQPVDWSLNEIEIMTSSPQSATNERWISESCDADAAIFRKSSNMTDQSTITDEMLEKEEIDLETLQNCFPEYSRRQLEATMVICQNDLEWVTSHLLDSPALFDMEDDDEESDKSDTLKPGKDSTSPAKCQVKSLADLCTALVKKTNRVDTDDLEMQVIQMGEDRLHKIEMFGRSRLHSLSQEDLGNLDYWPDDYVLDEFPLARPASLTKAADFRQSQAALLKTSPVSPPSPRQNGGFLPTLMRNSHFTHLSQSREQPGSTYASVPVVGSSSSSPLGVNQEPPAVKGSAASHEGLAVTQGQPVLPLEFVRHLESLFGPLHLHMESGGLALNDSTARKIYNCLKLQATKSANKGPDDQQLKSDEALARALQAEENTSYYASGTNVPGASVPASGKKGTVPGWTGHLPPWMSQSSSSTPGATVNEGVSMSGESNTSRLNSVSSTLNILRGNKGKAAKTHKVQRRNLGGGKSVWFTVRRRGQIDSLASIMEEEMAREEEQKEQLRIIQSTGDMEALATRIKRIELSHLFPSIGPDVLEDIFRSTSYSKEETIKTLQQSYNIQPAPMSQDKKDILEQVLRKSEEDFQNAEDLRDGVIPGEDSEIAYDALRKEARFCRQLAKDCQQQAYRYQGDGMQGAALFYRQRAKKYKEDECKANAKAAQVLFEKGSERLRMENTLDLHFYHLDEAINAVNMAIEMKEDEYRKKPDKKNTYLNIVTGWGRNSKNGIPKLKPAIIHHLWARCLQYEEKSPGMLKVYLGKKL